MLTKPLIKDIIQSNIDHTNRWSVQGLGMMRMYFDDRKYRLDIWDHSLLVPNVTLIHDHPWNFKSEIIAGTLLDICFHGPNAAGPLIGTNYIKGTLFCGEGGHLEEGTEKVKLISSYTGIYHEGDFYEHQAEDLHYTDYEDGTVTLVKRSFKADPDHAHVFWLEDMGFVSAEPRPATPDEVERVLTNSLQTWFQDGQ